jgi:hypothetical protein
MQQYIMREAFFAYLFAGILFIFIGMAVSLHAARLTLRDA